MTDVWAVPATIVKVHDGDTVLVDLDLGWHVSLRANVRVDGIAAPELKTGAGQLAREFAEKLLPPGTRVRVVSKKLLGSTEKYGRVLADLAFILPAQQSAIDSSFAVAMIAAGHAVAWDGTGKQPTT